MITSTAFRRSPVARFGLPAAAAIALAAAGTLAAPHADKAEAKDTWFKPGAVYATGNEFADPDILKVGNDYFAYSTNTGGAYLPVMHSTDLKTWYARKAYVNGTADPLPNNGINPVTKTYYPGLRTVYNGSLRIDPYYNDALPALATWADRSKCAVKTAGTSAAEDKWCVNLQAPTVERLKDGRYILAYATRVSWASDRWCLSVATAKTPQGPFVDRTTKPVVCSSDPKGSLDPDFFRDPKTGVLNLIWKNEGYPGKYPTRIWTHAVNEAGTFQDGPTTFKTGTTDTSVMLAQTGQAWEGSVTENPSMIYYGGRYLLYTSGNFWYTDKYATGQVVCPTARSACSRPWPGAIMGTNSTKGIWGPGGASAFVDPAGRLRLMYAAWTGTPTSSTYNQRTYRFALLNNPNSAGGTSVANAVS